MRYATRKLIGVLFVIGCCGMCTAAEGESSWTSWMPFSGSDTPAKATTPPPADSGGSTSWVSWPKLPSPSMPSLPGTGSSTAKADDAKPKPPKRASAGKATSPRNAWAQPKQKPEPKKTMTATMWDSVTSAPHTVAQTTKKAYHKTVDAITPGDSKSSPHVAQRDTGSSWWSHVTGADEPKAEDPRTVTEWMAQDRPKQ